MREQTHFAAAQAAQESCQTTEEKLDAVGEHLLQLQARVASTTEEKHCEDAAQAIVGMEAVADELCRDGRQLKHAERQASLELSS
ncbi:hypothetical protein WJX73_009869 [Symbiochloris irregularis]|uniref:Uncharacterized protein n=1 Tax=Symbiochloris irregularis TaxID=706552 RepID=A0AAW1PTJ4_9CHLO